jgi:hypothetical protein
MSEEKSKEEKKQPQKSKAILMLESIFATAAPELK